MRAFLLVLYLFQQPLQDAVTLVREGKFEQAQKKLEGQAEPENRKTRIAYHRLRGAIASGLRQYTQAATEMKKALFLAPQDDALKAAAGYASIEAGQSDEAVALLKDAGHSGQVLTLLGIAWYAKGEFKEAETSLNRAIVRDPGYDPAYRSLSQIVLESSATPAMESISSLCKWNKIVCAALQLRSARDSSDKTLEQRSLAALQTAPSTDAVARCALGQAYGWSNQWQSAQKELEACVELHPTPQNHYRLALVYQRLGNTSQARLELNERARLLGTQTESAVAAHDALGQLPH